MHKQTKLASGLKSFNCSSVFVWTAPGDLCELLPALPKDFCIILKTHSPFAVSRLFERPRRDRKNAATQLSDPVKLLQI